MAVPEQQQELHNNCTEYFVPVNPVRAAKKRKPKFSKASGTLVSALSLASSVAITATLFLSCRAVNIEADSITLAVTTKHYAENSVNYAVFEAEDLSALAPGDMPDMRKALQRGVLRGECDSISVDGLTPSSEYAFVFWRENGSGGEIIGRTSYSSGTEPEGIFYDLTEIFGEDAPSPP